MTQHQYQEAVDWLFVQAPNYQIDGKKAYKPGLQNITKLCEFFGNPQDKIKTIHVGGTNGKGSTCNMLASVLQEAGYKVGVYNSPHLIDFTERIKINGQNCGRQFVFEFIHKLKALPTGIRPSFFEFTTVMAFEYFYQNEVDYALIEVGLGGRLDSTNIIKPMVTAITNVALDHQNILGETVEAITVEKSGIIKNNTAVISGDESENVKRIIRDKAEEMKTDFIDATQIETHLESDLKGNYQRKNIKVVLALVQALRKSAVHISDDNISNGLLHVQQNTSFIGRWFEFSEDPLTICDTAHNHAGLEQVFSQLNSMNVFKHVVMGFVKDKKIEDILGILPSNAHFYFVKPYVNRGLNPVEYEELLTTSGIKFEIFDNLQSGYLAAKQNVEKDDLIFIGGSNFIVGEFLEKNLQK